MSCFRLKVRDAAERDPVGLARDYLLDHFQEQLSLQSVAEEVGLSREHLSRRFRHRYGESLKAFLTDLRMHRARDLLSASHARIEDLALLAATPMPIVSPVTLKPDTAAGRRLFGLESKSRVSVRFTPQDQELMDNCKIDLALLRTEAALEATPQNGHWSPRHRRVGAG